MRYLLLFALSCLAGCDRPQTEPLPEGAQEIAFDEIGPPQPGADPSPDSMGGIWSVAADGQSLTYSEPGENPWLTLACKVTATPPQFTIIRHAKALPGETALFPVIGNGMMSRFLADATLSQSAEGGEWRWEATVPASDPQLDVFEGTRDLKATLPGHGMLEIAGSRLPGQFVEWCRAGGRQAELQAPEESEPAEAE